MRWKIRKINYLKLSFLNYHFFPSEILWKIRQVADDQIIIEQSDAANPEIHDQIQPEDQSDDDGDEEQSSNDKKADEIPELIVEQRVKEELASDDEGINDEDEGPFIILAN